MYGGDENGTSSTQAEAVNNIHSSTIKKNLDSWYLSKLSTHSNNIADILYCNDRQPAKEIGYNYSGDTGFGYGNNTTYYATNYRMRIYLPDAPGTGNPTLKCRQKNDRFTVSDTVVGNGSLTYPIGTLTADEVVFAGEYYSKEEYIRNQFFYLINNAKGIDWWTLSPLGYLTDWNNKSFVFGTERPYGEPMYGVNYTLALRPSIALKSTAKITGAGTSSNPYKVIS